MYINIRRRHIVIWTIVIIFLAGMIFFLVNITNKITNGKKIIVDKRNLNISSYFAEYDLTVISNKNKNTYFIKEWYKENVGSRIDYLDYMKNTVSIINTHSSCYISNSGNKAYNLTENTYDPENVISLATFINILKMDIGCSCSRNLYDKNGKITISYEICNKENCMQSDELKHMGITTMELLLEENKPSIYTIYTGNKQEYACIVYNKFGTNIFIDDNIFNVHR